MRSVFRSVLVALVAVVALGAVAAASASAHEYFIEGKSMKELGLKEETVTSTVGLTTLGAPNFEIECASNSGTGTIKQGGIGSMTLKLAGCHVNTPANCSVKPIVLGNTVDQLVEVEGKLADRFSPEKVKGTLLTIVFENNGGTCMLDGELPAEGQITGLVGSEVESESGTLNFTNKSGSQVVLPGGFMTVKCKDTVKLGGINKGKKWSAKK